MSHEASPCRFFAESLDGEVVELSAAEAHHGVDVLRLRAGEVVEVFDGAGAVATGTFQLTGRKAAGVRITQRGPLRQRPRPLVELAFAVPKGKRLDWLLEKATELGAAALAPVAFQRSVVRPVFTPHARDRWRGICIAAAKQCGADFLPEIIPPRPLAEHLAGASQDVRIFGEIHSNRPLRVVLDRTEREDRIGVLVGPEGGLTDAEREAAEGAGFCAVRLGAYPLRVETAAVAFLAAIRACCEP